MFVIGEEVASALRERRPVVALETSVVAQGLPPPANLEAARRCAAAVRAHRAAPAAVAVIKGKVVVGASDADLQRLADPANKPLKAGARDLAGVCVASTAPITAMPGLSTVSTTSVRPRMTAAVALNEPIR